MNTTQQQRLLAAAEQFTDDAAAELLEQYLQIHENRASHHWIYSALDRIQAGEPEADAMSDYGWALEPKANPESKARTTHDPKTNTRRAARASG